MDNTITYSTDVYKFENECLKFLNYVKKYANDENFYVLYIFRDKNIIIYVKYDHGTKDDKHEITLISNDDLKKMYEILKREFESDFIESYMHTFSQGYSLMARIGDSTAICIDSNVESDRNWFYDVHNMINDNNRNLNQRG